MKKAVVKCLYQEDDGMRVKPVIADIYEYGGYQFGIY